MRRCAEPCHRRKARRESAGHAGHRVLQGYCNTRADDPECDAEAAQAILKEDSEEKENCEVSGKDNKLANLLARSGLTKTPGQRLFQQAKRSVNKQDSDNGG